MTRNRDAKAQGQLDREFCNAARRGTLEQMQKYHRMGANLDAWDSENWCHALHHALDDREKLTWMLDQGADIDVMDAKNRTILIIMAGGLSTVHWYSFPSDAFDRVITLSKKLDARDKSGETAVAVAIGHDNEDLLEALLDGGASVEGRIGEFGLKTPLLESMERQAEACYQLLLSRGADLRPHRAEQEFDRHLRDLSQSDYPAYHRHYTHHKREVEGELYRLKRDLGFPAPPDDPDYQRIAWDTDPTPLLVMEDGSPAPFLIKLAGLHKLPDLFQAQDWKGREAEALALHAQLLHALPEHHCGQLRELDLSELRREENVSEGKAGWAVRHAQRNEKKLQSEKEQGRLA